MDRESLLVEAIHRCRDIEHALDIDWQPDDETCRRVGWWLVRNTGTLFHMGRRLLELTAPGGALLPPPEFQLCRETEPTEEELFAAPMLQPWSLILFQTGSRPAMWKLGGTAYHRGHDCVWIWTRLLYLHREKSMARTDEGWVKLGKRMSA
ncbi:hypothetical protein [Sinorhizobium medicae]|uniref:hypothetical protein n=1 Tax=Sinorhizobium medicae TaxID=110321 RepID=UPI000FD805E2|nr:hypothetical protein [Sinorhizobium medicae]RVP47347.1 hypothetical protein CN078_26900 [Sinorhizobium medicae]RVP75450.1 hypothetical protein CN079_20155 [Sinorhizobium medicae]UWU06574.1 hypothetical protein N2598_09265 [Sinorhizobium medicae]